MRIRAVILALVALILIFSAAIAADSLLLTRYVLSGGGGDAKSGQYEIHASIGQSVTGFKMGSSFGINSGFWTEGIPWYHVFLPAITR